MVENKPPIPNKVSNYFDFVLKANDVHKGKYVYTNDYINSRTKIEIQCPIHGPFLQKPASHLMGIGCPACSNNKRHTTEEVKRLAKEIYGDLYDLDKLVYTNSRTPFEVVCRRHGSFHKRYGEFITDKSGCNLCIRKAMNTMRFKELCLDIHGKKYNYANTIYVRSNQKVTIDCPEHGPFNIRPNNHLNGQGCPKCGGRDIGYSDIIERNYLKYGDLYKILNKEYVTTDKKLTFLCTKHNIEFTSNIHNHLKCVVCQECRKENALLKLIDYTDTFIAKAKAIHGKLYDYRMVKYTGNKNKVHVICKKHGSFYVRPDIHLAKQCGCPTCNASKGELKIYHFLNNKKIDFSREYSIPGHRFRYDFYLPKYNLLIEFHGEQHYRPIEFFGGEDKFYTRVRYDRIKKTLAKNNKMGLLVIPYTKFKDIPNILKNTLDI